VFLFADRFDDTFGMRRGISDGRFKYIRRFTPWLPAAPYSSYPLSQQGWAAWKAAASQLQGYHQQIWSPDQDVEQLFDLRSDPWEVNNLSADPQYQQTLESFRNRLKQQMIDARDSGLVPEGLFAPLAGDAALADWLQANRFDFNAITDLAFAVTSGREDCPAIVARNLDSDDAVRRYWAIQGCLASREIARLMQAELARCLQTDEVVNRICAANALLRSDQSAAAAEYLLSTLASRLSEADALLLVDVIRQSGLMNRISADTARAVRENPQTRECVRKLVETMDD
jgi:hypothetical protein